MNIKKEFFLILSFLFLLFNFSVYSQSSDEDLPPINNDTPSIMDQEKPDESGSLEDLESPNKESESLEDLESNSAEKTLEKINELEKQLPEFDEEKSKQISKYFDEALKNYEEILNSQKNAEVRNTEKRIEANIKLLEEQQRKLNSSEATLRKIKLEYLRRYLILKKAKEEGKIDQKTYERELENIAKEYEFKVKSLSSDKKFYQGEVKKTVERLKALQELNRINKVILGQKQKMIKKVHKKRKPLTELEKFAKSIENLGCFEYKNFCISPEFK